MPKPFGENSSDQFTIPINEENTKLGKKFTMKVRENPQKPGRTLGVVWDSRKSLVEGFSNEYSYVVTFKEKNNLAGNHYHNTKKELFFPLSGNFTVILENRDTKEREEIELKTQSHEAIYVPNGIAHVVRSDTHTAILLVIASSPNTEEDEFPFKVF